MRASVLHLGIAGAAGALLAGSLLTTPASAAPTDASQIQALDKDLGVSIMVNSPTAPLTGQVTYTVRARNLGTTTDLGAAFNLTLPTNFGFVSATHPAGWTCSDPDPDFTGTVACLSDADFAAGDLATLVVIAQPQSAGQAQATADISATDVMANPDPLPANNTASVTVTVEPTPGELQDPGDPGDPGYPHGWFRGGGFGGGYGGYGDHDDYCDFDCF